MSLPPWASLWIAQGCKQTAYNSQNSSYFIHFQLVHKKNTNFHRTGEKLDLLLHELSHFLSQLLINEQFQQRKGKLHRFCSPLQHSGQGINPRQVRPLTRNHMLPTRTSTPRTYGASCWQQETQKLQDQATSNLRHAGQNNALS